MELAYNSSENFLVSIEEISTTGISITIKDTNEYKHEYEYSNDYEIVRKNNTGTYKKSTDKKTVHSIKIDNNTIKNIYYWGNIYGNLESGEYEFRTFSSDHHINIFINFTIDENGKITYKKPTCIYF